MSDAPANTGGLTTDAVPDVAANSINQSQPAVATPPVTAPPAAADPLAEPPVDRAVFDRGYVESIRKEAQRYREEARGAAAYNEVFGQYDEPDRAVWLDLARTWAVDPNRAAAIMQQIAGNVLGEDGAGAGSAGAAGPGDPPNRELIDQALTDGEALTPERVQELIDAKFSAQEAQRAEAAAINEVYAEVRNAGFDPDSAEGFMVLWNANHFTNGNIAQAVQMTNQYKQSIIDGYVQGRSSGRVPMPTANGVQATNLGEPIRNLDDAKKATEQFLRERRGAG